MRKILLRQSKENIRNTLRAGKLVSRNMEQVFFPEELTDANIYGNVTMTVKINKLGEIISVNIINSSGYKVLDNVAKKILFSVGEYEPFPRNLAIHADTISISRIWSFKKKSININEYE